jgi:hypothetical protein
MAFSIAQYQAVTDRVSSGAQTISAKIPEVSAAAGRVLGEWYVPGPVKDAVKWLADKIIQIAEWIWDKITELLKGVAAPVYMFEYSWDWQSIRGTASDVAGELTPQVVGVTKDWQGSAATAYTGALQPQAGAAAQIASIANQTANCLTTCAAAGCAFYVALGVIVVKFIISMTLAIGALGSVVFSWAGLVLIVQEAGVNTGLIITAVAALTALLGAQASQMGAMHGQAVDGAAFPGGHWPQAVIR